MTRESRIRTAPNRGPRWSRWAEPEDFREELVDLFERALDDGTTIADAFAVLGRWVGPADRDPAFLPLYARLITETVRATRDAASMTYYMDGWLTAATASPTTRRRLADSCAGRTLDELVEP